MLFIELIEKYAGILGLILSIIAIILEMLHFKNNIKQANKKEASRLVSKIYYRQLTKEEDNIFGSGAVPIPVLLQNCSNSEFKEVFVFIVTDKHTKYIRKNGKDLKNLRFSIEGEFFGYIPSLIDKVDILVPSAGHGCHVQLGTVIAFKDGLGKE